MIAKLKNIGPGALVTAAFIGPGTVTTCTLAGANFGYSLLWALVFATLATIVLQEMAARLGTVTQKGLGENLRLLLADSTWRWPMTGLIGVAIYLGNAAYEAGNISGAALGMSALTGEHLRHWTIALISIGAGTALYFAKYRHIESILLTLVLLMTLAFLATFVVVRPDLSALAKGLLVQLPANSLVIVIALIGTTIVPYNLFLHASAAKTRWSSEAQLSDARHDTAVAIGLGGLITILVASTAAASMFGSGISVTGIHDMTRQLEPLFGAFAKYMLGIGMFAAGLSSAITAPLATAYAMSEILGLRGGIESAGFRAIGLSVLFIGTALAFTGIKPITIIVSAQFANGLLLPIIAIFLLYAMNQKRLLGGHTNSWVSNGLGAIVLAVTAGLGIRLILNATGVA